MAEPSATPTRRRPRIRGRIPRPRRPIIGCPECVTSALCMIIAAALVAYFGRDGLDIEEIAAISAVLAAQCGFVLRAKRNRAQRRKQAELDATPRDEP